MTCPSSTWNTGSIVHFEVSGVMYLDASDPEIFTKIPQRQKYIEEFGRGPDRQRRHHPGWQPHLHQHGGQRRDHRPDPAAFEEVFSNVEK